MTKQDTNANGKVYAIVEIKGRVASGVKSDTGLGFSVEKALRNYINSNNLHIGVNMPVADSDGFVISLSFKDEQELYNPNNLIKAAWKSGRIKGKLKNDLEMTYKFLPRDAVQETAAQDCISCEYVTTIGALNLAIGAKEKENTELKEDLAISDEEVEKLTNTNKDLELRIKGLNNANYTIISDSAISKILSSLSKYSTLGTEIDFILDGNKLGLLTSDDASLRTPNFAVYLKNTYLKNLHFESESKLDEWTKDMDSANEDELPAVKGYNNLTVQLRTLKNIILPSLDVAQIEDVKKVTLSKIAELESEEKTLKDRAELSKEMFRKGKEVCRNLKTYENEFIKYLDLVKTIDERINLNQKLEVAIKINPDMTVTAYFPTLFSDGKENNYLSNIVNEIMTRSTDLLPKNSEIESGVATYQFGRNEKLRGRKTSLGSTYIEALEKNKEILTTDLVLNKLGFKPTLTILEYEIK